MAVKRFPNGSVGDTSMTPGVARVFVVGVRCPLACLHVKRTGL